MLLKSVKVVFLSLGVMSKLQPLDAGIIRSFKARYRRLLKHHFIDCIDANQPMHAEMRQMIQGVIRRLPHAEKVTAAECLDFDSESSDDPKYLMAHSLTSSKASARMMSRRNIKKRRKKSPEEKMPVSVWEKHLKALRKFYIEMEI